MKCSIYIIAVVMGIILSIIGKALLKGTIGKNLNIIGQGSSKRALKILAKYYLPIF